MAAKKAMPVLPEEVLERILNELPDDAEGIRAHAAFAQASKAFQRAAGGRAGVAARALREGIRLGDALRALGALGEYAAPHIPAVLARLENEDKDVRDAALRVLGTLGEHAAPHIPAIMARLENEDRGVRETAVDAFRALGEHAVPHIPAIVARLEDEDRRVEGAAVRVLGDLGEHIPAIEALLEHPFEYVRRAAAEVLARLRAANH